MEAGPVYKTFSRNRTIEELLYNTSLWTAGLNFIISELTFIKRLIKAYPFTATIPNLYERLQLFTLELDNFEKERIILTEKIDSYRLQVIKEPENTELESGHLNLLAYENLAEEIFMYLKHYKNLKIQIFEYISGLIK